MKILIKYKYIIVTLLALIANATSAFAQECSFEDCPGSVMSDITAAFATEGYWLLADVVWQIQNTTMGLWAPFIYILAYGAAGIMMAMGQPPKNYVWFILGPVIYSWLIFTPAGPVKGVGWRIINEPADQSIVWRKSEVGLLNTNQIANPSKDSAPGNSIELPLLFVWVDELVSATVQHLSAWSGVFRKLQNSGSTYTHQEPSSGGGSGVGTVGNENIAWLILSHSKWPMLESITQAKLVNHNTREAFIGFLSSECGDIFFGEINKALYINASNAPGRHLPESVFGRGQHSKINDKLDDTLIPAPSAVRELLKDRGVSGGDSYSKFIGDVISAGEVDKFKVVKCNQLFGLIFHAFRWEAGHIYNQIIRQVGGEYQIPEEQINYDFLYGWAVAQGNDPNNGVSLSTDDQKLFVINLILMHLIRNEFAFAPGQINKRWTQTEHNEDYAENYQKTIGSKTKYGEMYTWTKLMPYIQGILLYFLSAAYPFACMLMVVPGWHKTLFTWIGFFAWVKSWDVGFAMVGQLEKSIWAMLSNSDNDAIVNGRVHEVGFLNNIKVECQGNSGGANGGLINGLGCPDPLVSDQSNPDFEQLLQIVDYGLLLSGNLNLDLQNSYYIYLMSALYFGVPAVTGQLFLGARAGASSLVNSSIGGASQEAGRGTQTGFQSDQVSTMKANMATGSQAAYARSLRDPKKNNALAMGVYGNHNAALDNETSSNLLGVANGHMQSQSANNQAMHGDETGAMGVLATAGQINWQSNLSKATPGGAPGKGRALEGGAPLRPQAGGNQKQEGGGQQGGGALEGGPPWRPQADGNQQQGGGQQQQGGAQQGVDLAGGNPKQQGGAPKQPAGNGPPRLAGADPGGMASGLSAIEGALAPYIKAGKVVLPALNQRAQLESKRRLNHAESGVRAQQAAFQNAGFLTSAKAKGQRETAGRLEGYAGGAAEQDMINFQKGFAQSLGGQAAILGANPGMFQPERNVTTMPYIAGSGRGGAPLQEAFGYSGSNGYKDKVTNGHQALSQLSSPEKIGFRETSFAQAGQLWADYAITPDGAGDSKGKLETPANPNGGKLNTGINSPMQNTVDTSKTTEGIIGGALKDSEVPKI